jgi:amino acid adenylation domain-containing protein
MLSLHLYRCEQALIAKWLNFLNHSNPIEPFQNHLIGINSMIAKTEKAAQLEQTQPSAVWNITQRDYSLDACVHQLVARQAAMTPGAVALKSGQQTLSYAELNRQANQLAHYLQTLGAREGVLIGLCVERSLDMVVGLLAILKSGAAYVPLDPDYPTGRLSFMLQDAGVPILITQQHLVARFNPVQTKIISLDADKTLLNDQNLINPISNITSSDLAYVIYTSGSTGQPKGAKITHGSLLNLIFWHQRAFEVTASDRATQVASPSFDATGWELWPYLTCGASVYLIEEDKKLTPHLVRDWLVEQKITITFLPTPLAESVLPLDWSVTNSLRLLLTGADTLRVFPSPDLPFALINNYGPTEATIVATSGRILPGEKAGILPTIGRPIDNTQVFILNEHLRQVPVGVPGELYIGGAGLAQGYLNRPELTSEKFIPHPFSDDPQARLYKTGDMACYLSDGQISFIGRADHQIKIRGYRIEPNEIMAVLDRHPAIQNSLVVAHEETTGEKRLVAYVVLTPGREVTVSELRNALAGVLPDYMVPTIFVPLEELPVNHNGKIDRTALPAPTACNSLRDSSIVLPATPTEERVAEIVATLLGLKQIGIDDNFFMLGGHSLLGTQVVMRIVEAFGVEMPLRTIFEAPTVRLLSAEIEQRIVAKLDAMSDEEVLNLLQHDNRV